MTIGQFRNATAGLHDDTQLIADVVSAPFDDEAVELIDVLVDAGWVFLRVAVIDDVTRELRAEED